MKKNFFLPSLLILLVFLVVSGYFLFQELKIPTGLKGFYILTKEDPLFYSPFLDGKKFGASLEKLKEAEKRLKKVSIENYVRNKDSGAIETSYYIETLQEITLFPYQFLESLVSINQVTDDFLENPSKEKAEALLILYETATDFYFREISGLINVIETIEEEQRKKPILFVDSQTNLNIILADYQIIKKNAYALKKEIKEREKCLEGLVDCSELKKKHSIAYFFQLLEENLPPPSPEELKPEAELVRDTLHITFPEGETKGPYKIESACWQSPDNSHWMYLIYEKSEDISSVIPKLAEQNYYRRIRLPTESIIHQALTEQGLDFRIMIETYHYQCTNLTFYPTLLTLNFLKKEAEKKEIKPSQLAKESQYKFLLENQFSLLSPTINRLSSALNFHAQEGRLYGGITPLSFLYGIETAYSLFYFPYSRSIWRLDEKLQYLSPESEKIIIAESDRRSYTLDELQDMGYSDDEIKKFHIDLIELLEDLLELEEKEL